jgi:serine phosphatase RsbU (regulator of sigma subunit)
MQERPQRFISRILLFHGFLLLAVLTLVSLASAEIYRSTSTHAIEQAQSRQELLADETSRGISTFYSSIIADLGWIQQRSINVGRGRGIVGTRGGARTPPPGSRGGLGGPPEGNPPPPGGAPNAQGRARAGNFLDQRNAGLVAEQLGSRVSDLFTYNKTTGELVPYLPQKSTLKAGDLSAEMKTWLNSVVQVKVSRFMKLRDQGVSLVAADFGAGDPTLLVAVVPGEEIESTFLPLLNDQHQASATLVDSQLQVITCTNPAMADINLLDFKTAEMQNMISAYVANPVSKTVLFFQPLEVSIADSTTPITLGPRLVTLAPVKVADDEWTLMLADPLSNIDAQVNSLFQKAVIWAGCVALAIAAILISTAVQMIRVQSRAERVRHQVLTRELTQARRIQEQWLPDAASAPRQLDIAAINQPASHISGDFYNWFDLPDGRYVVVIGDVTGHGMAAAFLMATTQLLVRNTMARTPEPGPALTEVNRQLSSQMFRGQFVTMLVLTLDFEERILEIASAGHPSPLIAVDGKVTRLDVEGELVLGVEKNVVYPTKRVPLPPSASLLLYTDGVPDSRGPSGERFGAQRIIQSLAGHADSASQMIEAVARAVGEFRGEQELDDDLTLVAIHLRTLVPAARTPLPSLTAPASH